MSPATPATLGRRSFLRGFGVGAPGALRKGTPRVLLPAAVREELCRQDDVVN